MRLAIDHRTHYRFSEPQARVVQLLRLRPSDNDHQTVVSWRIDVDCDARLRNSRDGLGNETVMLYAEGPIETLDISVTGEVLTSSANGVLSGSDEPMPPLLFRRATPRTEADEVIADFVQAIAGVGEPLDRMHRLTAALHARFEAVTGGADDGATAGEAFARDQATPRDLAHMLIASARCLHIPARYVSGYRHDGSTSVAPHGWVEAHIERLGWVGFDPAIGLSPDEHHVRVAIGLDGPGAAPIAGSRLGFGEERLDVDLHVDQVGSDE